MLTINRIVSIVSACNIVFHCAFYIPQQKIFLIKPARHSSQYFNQSRDAKGSPQVACFPAKIFINNTAHVALGYIPLFLLAEKVTGKVDNL